MKKYGKPDLMTMAAWAADCAERVLLLFEKVYPGDDRPCKAIEASRMGSGQAYLQWPGSAGHISPPTPPPAERRGTTRPALLPVPLARRWQLHMSPSTPMGVRTTLLKPSRLIRRVGTNAVAEREWQAGRLPERLREEIMSRIIFQKRGAGLLSGC